MQANTTSARRLRRGMVTVGLAALILSLVAVVSGAFTTPLRDAPAAAGAGPSSTVTTAAPPTTAPPTTTLPPTTTTEPPPAGADGTLAPNEHGDEVLVLQQRLSDLGYWLGRPDGTYGQLTRQAVMAFQKALGLGRDGVAGPASLAAVGAATRAAPHEPSGSHLEIDLERQILMVVQDGQTRWVINTSTGTGEAYAAPGGGSAVASTPRGTFTINREVDGYRQAPLGTLYRPKYFHGGIAIHGAGNIPARPASHGCARVTNSAIDLLWSSGVATLGTTVLVY